MIDFILFSYWNIINKILWNALGKSYFVKEEKWGMENIYIYIFKCLTVFLMSIFLSAWQYFLSLVLSQRENKWQKKLVPWGNGFTFHGKRLATQRVVVARKGKYSSTQTQRCDREVHLNIQHGNWMSLPPQLKFWTSRLFPVSIQKPVNLLPQPVH